MDSEQFNAPPTTTAALTSYFRKYGTSSERTEIKLVHFQDASAVEQWFRQQWLQGELEHARSACEAGLLPIIGFSFYTWNTAEFLDLLSRLKTAVPELLAIGGGPHVQQAEDFIGTDPLDLIVLGEGEETFAQLLDAPGPEYWPDIAGLAFLSGGTLVKTAARARCKNLEQFPSPLDVLELCDDQGKPLYESISYETSRGCPFTCAFCEWGTGAIGSKMYQWPMERIRKDWQTITRAGIKDLWLADSNFGALKQDLDKARLIVELKEETGLPLSFATSWSKKHSPRVRDIALLLHRHQLLPHYQLALQTLTPEALKLSNRQNMSSNQYEPIAKQMSEEGVPIAAELIWGLPGDRLQSFESNLDRLLAVFPNINIFGYTLLPGTEFYRRREEYRIEAIPVAGYGKAKGEYVVGCHSFDRNEGEEGYFLITAHILLIHGHIMPLTTRMLALLGDIPVSPLLRLILRGLLSEFATECGDIDSCDRMQIYEQRDALYLAALEDRERCFKVIRQCIAQWLQQHAASEDDSFRIMRVLELDTLLCPRTGGQINIRVELPYDACSIQQSLAAMELPAPATFEHGEFSLGIQHPGGVGEILFVADGGSWLKGEIESQRQAQLIASV
jgi:hypothetical protein